MLESLSSAPTPSSSDFSALVDVVLDGIGEPMDNETSAAFEVVTMSFLNEQLNGSMAVSAVNVLGQSVFSSGRRDRGLSGESGGRTLEESSSSSLLVDLAVEGTVTNWAELASSDLVDVSAPSSLDDTISTMISRAISSNYDEYVVKLGDEPEFAPYQSMELSSAQSQQIEPKPTSRLVLIITGTGIALVVLVGSLFYMERNSRRRRLSQENEYDEENSAYDLKDVTNSYAEDSIVDKSSRARSGSRAGSRARSRNTNGASVRNPPANCQSAKAARMTSLMDHVSI